MRAAPYTVRNRLRETPNAPDASANGKRGMGGGSMREETRENRMTLDPCDHPFKNLRRNMSLKSRLAALPPHVPSCVTTYETACDSHWCKQPWISAMRHQPEQEQVSATGQRQRYY